MVVYIFSLDLEKVRRGELDAGKCETKIKGFPLTLKNVDPFYREETKKVWVKASEDAPEMPTNDSIIVVDPEIGFTPADIADDFSFGNGVTIGGVRLKDGRWIPCGFVVFDHTDKAKADNLLTPLKNIFKGR